MQCLDVLGFMDCYYLDIDKIYNAKRKQYMTEVGEYRYKIRTKDGIAKSITIKEIYKRLYNKVFCIDDIERLEGEEFREVEGTEGNYLVSNYGRVISYISNHAMILKPTITPKGYERLQITIEGKRYNKFVHSLVAAAWLGQPQNINPLEVEIHHKGEKTDNSVNNIMYVSKQEHRKIHAERREKEQCQTTTVIQTKEA